jgi:hypothetical protein
MKTTKTQARECYDSFHGTLRALHGGTVEENLRMAPRCLAELESFAAQAELLAGNPSKLLAADHWLLGSLREIPGRVAVFRSRYAEVRA